MIEQQVEADTACRNPVCDCPRYAPRVMIGEWPCCVECHCTEAVHQQLKYGDKNKQ